uniref:Nedd4 family interacting protein n=1 Tax=Anopheles melas TaxID=34690 RepID=A0A182TTQ7_9DIPT
MPPTNNRPDELPPPKADFSAPPPYEANDPQQQHHHQHEYGSQQAVPVPELTTKLPTYEEVQMEKMINHELPMGPMGPLGPPQMPPPPPSITSMGGRGAAGVPGGPQVTFIAIDADGENITADNGLLGTDIMFVTAFLIAFLFNWIGFLVLTCFCHTIAARYGALSGFGLSLAKWTLIMKHSTDFASHENSWLWWLIMAFGFLICVRALVQYISIKRTWRLLSASAQERLLFFY